MNGSNNEFIRGENRGFEIAKERVLKMIDKYKINFNEACDKLNAKRTYRDFVNGHLDELKKKTAEVK